MKIHKVGGATDTGISSVPLDVSLEVERANDTRADNRTRGDLRGAPVHPHLLWNTSRTPTVRAYSSLNRCTAELQGCAVAKPTRNPDGVSFWLADALGKDSGPSADRPPLSGPHEADVCIVGAGFTGLWTAYYLALAAPSLRIVLVEAEHVGFGASGRNGGWLTGALAGHPGRYAARNGDAGVLSLQKEMDTTVDRVARVCQTEGIDAELRKGGSLRVARNPAQVTRLRASIPAAQRWGVELEWLDAEQTRARVDVSGAQGATFSPHCASVHPGRLVLGLAAAVEARGVTVYEHSPAIRVKARHVTTTGGHVSARHVVLATEAYTAALPGLRRRLLPMNSSMIVTEPLPDDVLGQIGLRAGETLGDAAHVCIYAQRTRDGRIALGGRGIPYRYGSTYDASGRPDPSTVAGLRRTLGELFPALRDVRLAAAWSGVLGVARDWCASVGMDSTTGIAWAGGYTGHGVATANLAGRTLTDLIRDRETALTELPWVGRVSPGWEPEPLRWLGVRGLYATYRLADRLEARHGAGPSPLARMADRVTRKP